MKHLVAILAFLLGLLLIAINGHTATTLLPNGKQCFSGPVGPLNSGSVDMFFPSTATPKTTWLDPNQIAANTQPIQLDANGCAVIYGVGSYRQRVFDGPVVGGVTTGNQIWDQLTTDTSAYNSTFWAGISGGTPNALTVTYTGFNGTDGTIINFIALASNTGPATLNPSGFGNVSILQPTANGPVSLTAGSIVANNPVSVIYSTVANAFLLQSAPPVASAVVAPNLTPQGYLTLSSDVNNVIVSADTTAATAVYYSPYTGNQIAIWNGSAFVTYSFAQLPLTLTGAFTGSTAFDACIFLNNGTVRIGAMPAWSVSTGVSAARASAIQRVSGLWVNTSLVTVTNGANTYSIPAQQCTVIGSFFTDVTAGQVSDYVSWGQSRKWATCNFYNQKWITLQVGDSTPSWPYTTAIIRPSNNVTANSLITFTCLPEESTNLSFKQLIQAGNTNGQTVFGQIGIGYNSTTAFSGTTGEIANTTNLTSATFANEGTVTAGYQPPPVIGAQTITALETIAGTAGASFIGTQKFMLLMAQWRG